MRSVLELRPGSRRVGANLEGPRVGVCSISGCADLASDGGRGSLDGGSADFWIDGGTRETLDRGISSGSGSRS